MEIIRVNDKWGMVIFGFRGTVLNYMNNSKLSPIDYYLEIRNIVFKKFSISYQIFKSGAIFNQEHIKRIVQKINMAFETNSNILTDVSMEFLLYLANSRQIKEALERVGVKFPRKISEEMDFNQILFGEYNSLNKAMQHLASQFNFPFEYGFIPLTKTNWMDFLNNHKISPNQLINIVKSYNVYIPKEISSLENITNKWIIENISEGILEKAIVDALTRSMVELYIKNYKKG